MNRTHGLVAIAALAGAISLTAAARSTDLPGPDPAMTDFVSCMREHGQPVPDPVPNGQGSYTVDDPPTATPQQLDAHTACDPILRASMPAHKWDSVHSPGTTTSGP